MRKGSSVAVSRAQPFDRNPATRVAIAFALTAIAPHAVTTRATYTVPAGRKAQSAGGNMFADRVTAATTPSLVQVSGSITPNGGTQTTGYAAQFRGNNVDSRADVAIQSGGTLVAGDSLQFFTTDLSTGGTVDYFGGIFLQEFDA